MSTAIQKTEALKRLDLPVGVLICNDLNPNQMTDAQFNLLFDNIERTGMTDPILVRDLGDGTYRVIGGHHRLEVGKMIGFDKVPCTVIDDPDFDADAEKFQMVRMNVIRGQMSPDKFMKLYESLSDKYSEEVMKDAFGFSSEAEFRKLVRVIEADLPPEMKTAFKEAAKDAKTLDDLATILNKLIATHGETLPYGYMLIDFGNQDSVWMRMGKDTRKAVMSLGDRCRVEKVTMDTLFGGLVRLAAAGKAEDLIKAALEDAPKVEIPQNAVGLPTADFLESLQKTSAALG